MVEPASAGGTTAIIIQAAIARKALDTQKMLGQAAVRLIQSSVPAEKSERGQLDITV